jgi:hypothetical protein
MAFWILVNRDFQRAAYRVQWQHFDLIVCYTYFRVGRWYQPTGWPGQVHPWRQGSN